MFADRARVLILPGGILGGSSEGAPLRAEAIDIRPAPTAEAALAIAAEYRPTLVVFESPLPDMGAAELCVRLGELLGEMPQLLMISRDGAAPLDEALAAKVDAHLVSPVEPLELLDALMLLLEYGSDRSLRAPMSALVHLRGFPPPGAEPGGEAMAMALELTERTLRVETTEPLTVDASGVVRLFLPGASSPLDLAACVLLCLDPPRMHYLLAIDPTDEERAALERFLGAHRERSAGAARRDPGEAPPLPPGEEVA